ncbi:hypothetical protein AX15_001482 [Amanita polypyramis BW_CC]|nr:hypothetical protein AX15_001482 [Amanita polypyramis BW_CC]
MSDEGNLVIRRSRRSTAGNRMQAALAEMSQEDTTKDLDDDVEFINDKEEDDIFESDFESTDEEAAQAEIASGEKEVQDEEKRARKQAKSKFEKLTAAADARLRVTFDPEAATKAIQKPKPRRRISLGLAVNAETGEVDGAPTAGGLDSSTIQGQTKIRQSRRKQTIQNTVETVKRLKSSEERKAAIPKKPKVVKKLYTQGELIAKALDNEEGNLVEHRDYLRLEEEKRKRARVVKTSVTGPLVRWVSCREEVKVVVQSPAPAPAPVPLTTSNTSLTFTSFPTTTNQTAAYPYSFSYRPGTAYSEYMRLYQSYGQGNLKGISGAASDTQSQTPILQQQQQPAQVFAGTSSSQLSTAAILASTPTPAFANPVPTVTTQLSTGVSQPQQPQPVEKIETVTRNYVVHESGQQDGIRKPSWADTMKAMFGDHVRWDEMKVYVGKGRPLSRPKHICPITGRQAIYMDPRTGVPYADARAFRVLTELLEHEYVWSAELGCYVGKEEAEDTPADVDDMDIGC